MLGCALFKVHNISYLEITIAIKLQPSVGVSHNWSHCLANRTLGFLHQDLRTCPQQSSFDQGLNMLNMLSIPSQGHHKATAHLTMNAYRCQVAMLQRDVGLFRRRPSLRAQNMLRDSQPQRRSYASGGRFTLMNT